MYVQISVNDVNFCEQNSPKSGTISRIEKFKIFYEKNGKISQKGGNIFSKKIIKKF